MNLKWQLAQNVEALWWRTYLRGKPADEYLDWKRSYWYDFLERHNLSVGPSDRILDAGCGPAGIFTVLPEHDVTAIDPLLDQYAATLPHFYPAAYPNVAFRTQRLEDLDETAAFDTIFCLNAINHVADLHASLDRLLAALTPNGKFILSIDVHNYAALKHLFRAVPGDILHPQQHSLADYQRMLAERGATVTHTRRHHREAIFSYYVLTVRK